MGNVRSETRPYGMGSVRLTHGHAIALRASDLSRIWTQFAKKHILRLEPLHLATNAISIGCAGCCVDCGVFAQVQPVFCGVRCCGRGGFQTRLYATGNGGLKPALRDGFGQTGEAIALRSKYLSRMDAFAIAVLLRLEP